MKHIFSIHSNICVIVIYDTVKKLIERGEDVIILSDRNAEFPFFQNSINFIDIQYITDNYRGDCSTPIKKLINYTFRYLPKYKESAKKVIDDEDFILYISSCNYFTIAPYLCSNHCKGYYFIEEGTMAYMDVNKLKKRYERQVRKGQFLLNFVGAGTRFDYEITPLYKGCICISEYAFPWCNDRKIINNLQNYKAVIPQSSNSYTHVIVTDYLDEDIDVILRAFRIVMDLIIKDESSIRICIKMHPTAFSYQQKKIELIKEFVNKKYEEYHIDFVPVSFTIENLLMSGKTQVYSIFGVSSLLLYAVNFGSRSFVLNYNDEKITCDELFTVQDILDDVYKNQDL